jgi:hypothetical protein
VDRDTEMATGSTDWSKAAIAWIYEHDASLLEQQDAASYRRGAAVGGQIR